MKAGCGCEWCEAVRRIAADACAAATATVGQPLTECSNELWLLAEDVCGRLVMRLPGERKDEHRKRVLDMVRRGEFLGGGR